MNYLFKKTEPNLYTVGFYGPITKEWTPVSDHESKEEAEKKIAYLNGDASFLAKPITNIETVKKLLAPFKQFEVKSKLIGGSDDIGDAFSIYDLQEEADIVCPCPISYFELITWALNRSLKHEKQWGYAKGKGEIQGKIIDALGLSEWLNYLQDQIDNK